MTLVQRKDFKGNISVSVSENEVRVWVCNERGENIFRFKATGKVYRTKDMTEKQVDVTVIGR